MVHTLFFSRLRDMNDAERAAYAAHLATVRAVVEADHPGFLSQKTYVADDGERLTVVTFRDEASMRGWRTDPVHRSAKAKGRTDYYERYRVVVCEEVQAHTWTRSEAEVSR